MNRLKIMILRPLLKLITRKNIVKQPQVVKLDEKQCVGYKIATTFEKNQKKKDIPPFFHEIYDNNKLDKLCDGKELKMNCVFEINKNGKDFNYYITVEKEKEVIDNNLSEITLPEGEYVSVEIIKRSHTAVSFIAAYIRGIWIEQNGFKSRNSPLFIQYDKRFHNNYKTHGCKNGVYPGNPIATIYFPIN